jgi:hypothetical protein
VADHQGRRHQSRMKAALRSDTTSSNFRESLTTVRKLPRVSSVR